MGQTIGQVAEISAAWLKEYYKNHKLNLIILLISQTITIEISLHKYMVKAK